MSRSAQSFPPHVELDDALCSAASLAAQGNTRWRPGLSAGLAGAPCQSEIFAAGNEAGGVAAALALALDDWRSGGGCAERKALPQEMLQVADHRAVLWVQTQAAARLNGVPFRAGLPPELQRRLIYVRAKTCKDALFALEEGVRCREVGFVIGEVAGNPRSLDFTASRRLTLAAQRHKVPLYLIRLDGERALSSARMRWDAKASPSLPYAWDAQAPGQAVWHAELFRARGPMPGQWLLREDAGALLAEKPDVAPSGDASSGLGQMSLARHRPARKAIVADNDTSLVSWARGLQHRYATSKAAGR